jgi:hypothetical protein
MSKKTYRQVRRWVSAALILILALSIMGSTFAQTPSPTATPNRFTDVEMNGVIEAMTTDTITVNGQVINIRMAELNVPIALGDTIKVEGWFTTEGGIIARELNSPVNDDGTTDPLGEIEIVATLDQIVASTMIVAGRQIDVSLAEIKAGVATGELVKIHLTIQNGVWVAREVEVATEDDLDQSDDDFTVSEGEFEIVGELSSFSGTSIVVAGRTIDISQAEIKAGVVVGAVVKVHLSLVDGTWVAREVEVFTGDDDDDDNSNDNSNDNSSDDNGNDNSNTNDNSADDNGNDNSDDDNSNDNVSGGSNDNVSGGSNDNRDDDNAGSGSGNDDQGGNDDNSGSGDGDDDNSGHGGDDDHGGGGDDGHGDDDGDDD